MTERIRRAVCNECGTSMLEATIWIGVVLIICTYLILFGKSVKDFFADASLHVGDKDTVTNYHSQKGIVLVH